jgi:hypothetical protein
MNCGKWRNSLKEHSNKFGDRNDMSLSPSRPSIGQKKRAEKENPFSALSTVGPGRSGRTPALPYPPKSKHIVAQPGK